MCKKSRFPVVFNVILAFFITLTVTIFTLAAAGNLTMPALVVGMIQGFALNLTLETLIDLPAFGNFFVQRLHLNPESLAGYLVRVLFIVLLLVVLMSFILMFCELGFALGAAFFGVWVARLPAIFVVAYITAVIVVAPSMKAAQALCVKD